jgi:non-ribosomal peptide synthetase component E (peptide arylation enzyme)
MDEGRRGDREFVTIPGALRVAADRYGDRSAIVDGPVTLTFGGLAGAVHRVAGALIAAGVARGDRVAI